jgi:hypothetical protein
VRRTFERRVRALEEQAPRNRPFGPLVAILPEGMTLEAFRATLLPWYTPQGEPREPVIVVEDDRPAPQYEVSRAGELPASDYDYGDDWEEPV